MSERTYTEQITEWQSLWLSNLDNDAYCTYQKEHSCTMEEATKAVMGWWIDWWYE